MKKVVTALAAATALGISAPVAAQFYSYPPQQGYGYAPQGFGGLSQQFRARIQAGIQRGLISRKEAAYLFHKVRQLADVEQRIAYRGYSHDAERTLANRAQGLDWAIRKAERSPVRAYRGW